MFFLFAFYLPSTCPVNFHRVIPACLSGIANKSDQGDRRLRLHLFAPVRTFLEAALPSAHHLELSFSPRSSSSAPRKPTVTPTGFCARKENLVDRQHPIMFRRQWSGLPKDASFYPDLKALGCGSYPAHSNFARAYESSDISSMGMTRSDQSKTPTTTSSSSSTATRAFAPASALTSIVRAHHQVPTRRPRD